MNTFFTQEFLSDLERLDKPVRAIACKKISRIIELPQLGKPMHGQPNRFTERFLQYRLIYEISGNTIVFAKIGKRDNVYRFP